MDSTQVKQCITHFFWGISYFIILTNQTSFKLFYIDGNSLTVLIVKSHNTFVKENYICIYIVAFILIRAFNPSIIYFARWHEIESGSQLSFFQFSWVCKILLTSLVHCPHPSYCLYCQVFMFWNISLFLFLFWGIRRNKNASIKYFMLYS